MEYKNKALFRMNRLFIIIVTLCLFSTGVMAQEPPTKNTQPANTEQPAVTEVNSQIKADTTKIDEVKPEIEKKGKTISKKSEEPKNEEGASSANDNKASVGQDKEKTKKQETKPENQSNATEPKATEQKSEAKANDGVANVDNSKPNNNENNKRPAKLSADELKAKVDSLSKKIEALNKIIAEKEAQIGTKEERVNALLNRVKEDSLTIIKYRKDVSFVDTCLITLANKRLDEPFNKRNIDNAIRCFDMIYTKDLRQGLSIVLTLLQCYEKSYLELKQIVTEASKDIDGKFTESPSTCAKYKAKYIAKIKAMPYYKSYYKTDWPIGMLDIQIDRALKALENHSAKTPADFSKVFDE